MQVFVDWFNRVWKVPPNAIAAELVKAKPNQKRIDAWGAELAAALDLFERLLEDRGHLLGEDFSAAGLRSLSRSSSTRRYHSRTATTSSSTRCCATTSRSATTHPHLESWIRRVDARPRVAGARHVLAPIRAGLCNTVLLGRWGSQAAARSLLGRPLASIAAAAAPPSNGTRRNSTDGSPSDTSTTAYAAHGSKRTASVRLLVVVREADAAGVQERASRRAGAGTAGGCGRRRGSARRPPRGSAGTRPPASTEG